MEAIALRTANRVIADAEGVKQFLERRHGSDIACTVIPYGSQIVQHASLDLLDAFSAKPYAYYLIVCRLEPENHLFEIMKGFAASHSKYSLIIVGNHLGRSKYVQKLASIQNVRIKFVGTVYDKDKLQSLRYYCKAYFHGHSVGGTNPSLLEALGCGNVVIAHDNAFNREVAGDLGFYFRTDNDVTRFVEMMDVMDDNTRKQLSASAQKRIIDNYTWESVTDKYLSLLQSYYPS